MEGGREEGGREVGMEGGQGGREGRRELEHNFGRYHGGGREVLREVLLGRYAGMHT